MIKNNKTIFIISAITILLLMIIGGTIAFFGWTAEEEATVNVTILSGSGECSLLSDNNVLLEPTDTRNGGRIIRLKASQEVGNKAVIVWNMFINEISGLQDKTFKYEMINNTNEVSYGTGNFENTTAGSSITLSNNNDILDIGVEYEFILYLWIDGTIGNNPLTMANKTLDFDLSCQLTSVPTETQ